MNQFYELSPDRVLDAVEKALSEGYGEDVRATGRSIALNSLENRVYQIELDDGTEVVTKFYRPGRWSREQILEEHQFLLELESEQIPVVAPLNVNGQGATLGEASGIFFAVFPRVRGRIVDELRPEQLDRMGRYLARIHTVGARFRSEHRLHLDVETYGYHALETVLQTNLIPTNYQDRYRVVVEQFLELVTPFLENAYVQPVHGDCHLGNTLWEDDAPFFLDFDDMVVAPPVQDVWMIIRGRDEFALKERSRLIEAYEEFRDFDRSSLALIEPLRGLRMVHYASWVAGRWDDPAFPRAFPLFTQERFWQEEMEALLECMQIVREGFGY